MKPDFGMLQLWGCFDSFLNNRRPALARPNSQAEHALSVAEQQDDKCQLEHQSIGWQESKRAKMEGDKWVGRVEETLQSEVQAGCKYPNFDHVIAGALQQP